MTTGRGRALLPELGFGTAQFGNLNRRTSSEEAAAAVSEAFDNGIRYFDTAPHYGLGLSETRLGAALRGQRREDFVVSTKVGRLLVPSPETAGEPDPGGFLVPADHRREWDFSSDGVTRSLEASLERLELDSVDVVYVHDPDDHLEEALTGALPALRALREQGVVRAIGVGMNQAAPLATIIERFDVDLVMCAGRLTLLDRTAVDRLLPIAAERGVGVVAAGVFNSGLLSSPHPTGSAQFDYKPVSAEILERVRTMEVVCESFGLTLPEAAVQFPLRYPSVVSVVVGMRTAEQVQSLVARSETKIPEDLWTALEQL